jgi:ADP-heptose:LPS heptosyltransferase
MLAMAEAAIGGPADWTGTFEVSAAAQALATQRLPPGPRYVGLAPGSREARKNWPLDRFMALAPSIAAMGCTPVFLIGPQEREWLATLRAAVPQALFPEAEPVDPALGVSRLEFAIALGRRLAATVANDSGVGHLMAAIGTPLVSLFGPSDARRWAPFGERVVIVRAQDFGGDAMEAIPVEAVSRALARVLENCDR